MQLRADLFNVFNHPTFAVGAPSSAAIGSQAISQATYGQLTYAYPARNMMLSLKVAF